MITYKFQNMTNLRFYMLEKDSFPDTVQVLKRKRLRYPNYQLDLRIIGSSHILSLRTVSAQLTECLTCLPLQNIKARILMEFPFPLKGDNFTTIVGNIRYTIKFHAKRLEKGEYQRQHHLLLRNKTKESLHYKFPVRKGTDNLNPLTLLKYSCQARLIHFWTYHTYPDECGIADTHTKIEILNT